MMYDNKPVRRMTRSVFLFLLLYTVTISCTKKENKIVGPTIEEPKIDTEAATANVQGVRLFKGWMIHKMKFDSTIVVDSIWVENYEVEIYQRTTKNSVSIRSINNQEHPINLLYSLYPGETPAHDCSECAVFSWNEPHSMNQLYINYHMGIDKVTRLYYYFEIVNRAAPTNYLDINTFSLVEQ